jgi:tRNA uridine 5-carboxymethylaminomethyl modification enzyme
VNFFDVIVVGAGHAGCEAAHAAARLGKRVLLTAIDIDSVAYMACNPSIGGLGKSHLVYEIDALGGLMAKASDRACIQMRTLNKNNGPAVQALRAQVDKHEYHKIMLETIQSTPNITLRIGEVAKIITKSNAVKGVEFSPAENLADAPNTFVGAKSVVVCTGVYLNSKIIVGHNSRVSGPRGAKDWFGSATKLTDSLIDLGIRIQRFKTGTPPRIASESIDYAKTSPQPPDTESHFSFMTTEPTRNVVSCHLTYTTPETHKVIRDNLKETYTYGTDNVKGAGARYCPSIEDKIVRFASADRHQVFLEPESLSTNEIYMQGCSTSLPPEIQKQFVQTVTGLEHAVILRSAYAIEYDCIDSTQLKNTLEHKDIRGLFFAGQVNGTSGYEEAAAQGLLAGCNAASSTLTLSRTNSYLGVLVDDLVNVGTKEPYRMFTSRAEHRLYLRKDNADRRLTPIGHELGLVDEERWAEFQKKMDLIEKCKKGEPVSPKIKEIVEIEKMYEGYLHRESARIEETKKLENTLIPDEIDYHEIKALRMESRIKLSKVRPQSIAAAQRISGVTPADINILLVFLKRKS